MKETGQEKRHFAGDAPQEYGPTCRLNQHQEGEEEEPGFSHLGPSGEEDDQETWEEPEDEQPPVDARVQEAEKRAEELRVSYLRAMAEMENLRKRTTREVDQARRFAIEGFARDLLPVADNLERALGAVLNAQGSSETDTAVKALVEGVRLIQNELTRSFGKHGLVRIEALNTPFDPNLHQAMMQIDNGEVAPGTVVQELQPGYLLNDRLLRPAMVSVAKG